MSSSLPPPVLMINELGTFIVDSNIIPTSLDLIMFLQDKNIKKSIYDYKRSYVLSKRFGTPLKYSINMHGYAMVNLMINGKRKGLAVHTAVARTFLNGYQDGLQVNHKDGNIVYDYDSIAECAKHIALEINQDYRHIENFIWRVLKGYRKTYKGLQWIYK